MTHSRVRGLLAPMNNEITIIGVAGGSGSGKTTFARALAEKLGPELSFVLYQDNYYKDQSAKFDFDGGSVNFDHPDAIDFELLAEHIKILKAGDAINIPIYDFATHSRKKESIHQTPKKVVIIDGILIFSQKIVCDLMDVKVFVQTPEEIRFQRRLERDVEERGRTPEGVKNQFEKQVKPMHDMFVEPSQEHAHIVASGTCPIDFKDNLEKICADLV